MGNFIGSWRKPKGAASLARAIMVFIEEELGLDLDPEGTAREDWGGVAVVETKWGAVDVIVQGESVRGAWYQKIGPTERSVLMAWEKAGSPPAERIAFNLGDVGGPISPEAEAAARAVMAGEACAATGWTPEEVARVKREMFPDILRRVEFKRATGKSGPPADSAELAEAVKACLKAAYGLEATGDDFGLDVDLGPRGVMRMVVGRPEEFQAEAARPGEEFRPVKVYARPRSGEEFAESFAALAREELGMTVESFDVLGDPVSWVNLSFMGLYARIDGVDVAVATDGKGLARVIAGEGEDELLKRYRAKLVALGMDPAEMSDCIPDGYSFDLLTADEAKAVRAFREGKASAPKKEPARRPKKENKAKAAAGDRSYTPEEN